jgi:hypothetical protein
VAISVASEQRIELLGTVELLHDHLTTSLCQTVFQQTRTTERERQWSLEALVTNGVSLLHTIHILGTINTNDVSFWACSRPTTLPRWEA